MKSRINKSVIILTIFIILTFIRNFFPELRHVIYGLFPLALLLFIINFKPTLKLKSHQISFLEFAIFIIVLVSCSFLNFTNDFLIRTFKESYFLITALLTAIITIIFIDDYTLQRLIKKLFILSIIFSVFIYYRPILNLVTFNFGDFLFRSVSETESTIASFFGFISIYFFLGKRYTLFLISFFFAFMGGKRIVLLGTIFVVLVYYLLYPFRNILVNNKKIFAFIFTLSNIGVAFVLYYISRGDFEEIFRSITGFSSAQLTMGRFTLYEIVFDHVGFFPIYPFGFGYINGYLEYIGASQELIHSDILKVFIDLGMLIGTLYFFVFYKYALSNYNSLIILIFYNVLMLTDNLTIYYGYMYLILILLYITSFDSSKTKEEAENG